MSKSLAASNKIMKNYLSELMTDEEELMPQAEKVEPTPPAKTKQQQLEKLLTKVPVKEPEVTITTHKSERALTKTAVKAKAEPTVKEVVEGKTTLAEAPLATKKSQGEFSVDVKQAKEKESFQAMFFEVAGLTIAVPLIELGGIHNFSETTNLMGKPDWFKGIMLNREEKISVVDSARWVMPEKCDEELINSLNYQYVIMLSNSHWGLTAEHLVDTVTLHHDDVKWLDSPSKRPWLAGLVKERMCALLDVESLIKLLNEGENIHQQ